MKPITIENFQEHLGKKVEVEISCYSAGMCHPVENTLIGMNPGTYYFRSDEDDETIYWHWVFSEDKDCSISVWDQEEYDDLNK